MRLVKTLVISLGGLSAAMMLTPTFGSGFALNEQSASGLGNAFAGGAAIAEDASTIYFNPIGSRLLNLALLSCRPSATTGLGQ